MDSQSTPRLTAPYLDRYVGRNVIIVGKVVQLRGEVATIDADGAITAQLNRVRWPLTIHCSIPSALPLQGSDHEHRLPR